MVEPMKNTGPLPVSGQSALFSNRWPLAMLLWSVESWGGGGGEDEADLSSENGGIGMSSLVCSLRFLIVICTGQSRESTLQRH